MILRISRFTSSLSLVIPYRRIRARGRAGVVVTLLLNSPIFFVDRVETPIMIVQGDMDYAPMRQGEEFLAGLDRQNKRAAFVRYLGAANLIDRGQVAETSLQCRSR